MDDGQLNAELHRLEQRFEDLKEAHGREQVLLKEQLSEYKLTIEKKHLEMNEVRRQINDERGQYETRLHSDARFDGVSGRVSAVEQAVSSLNGRMIGLGAGITVFMFLIQMAFRFWSGK